MPLLLPTPPSLLDDTAQKPKHIAYVILRTEGTQTNSPVLETLWLDFVVIIIIKTSKSSL